MRSFRRLLASREAGERVLRRFRRLSDQTARAPASPVMTTSTSATTAASGSSTISGFSSTATLGLAVLCRR